MNRYASIGKRGIVKQMCMDLVKEEPKKIRGLRAKMPIYECSSMCLGEDIRVNCDTLADSKKTPKLSFKQLYYWEKYILINILLSDKYISTEAKLDILRTNRKDMPYQPIPRGSGRGVNASYMVFDCSYNCKYLSVCKNGKRCPYDKD